MLQMETALTKAGKQFYPCNGVCEGCPVGGKCAAGEVIGDIEELWSEGICYMCGASRDDREYCPECEYRLDMVQEQERQTRLLDDPILRKLHDVVMRMAENWRKEKSPTHIDWERGRVSGSLLAWYAVALRLKGGFIVDEALKEYKAMVCSR